MLTISNKGKLMPESPIRKLVPFAEKAKQKGVKVIWRINGPAKGDGGVSVAKERQEAQKVGIIVKN